MTLQENTVETPEAKAEPVRNWIDDPKYHHKKVYTSKGVAIIQGVAWNADAVPDSDPDRALVEVMETADQYDLSFKSLRFKAIDDGYRDKYVIDNTVKTASGAPSVSNGDEIAEALKGLTIEELTSVAIENSLYEKWEAWRKRNLNLGMRRMNLGNMLRTMAKHGTDVTFFGKPVAEHMTVHGKELAEKAEAEAKAKEETKAAREKARLEAAEAKKAEKAADAEAKKKAKEAEKEAANPTPKSKRKPKKAKEEATTDAITEEQAKL
jgi:hypothetical protein